MNKSEWRLRNLTEAEWLAQTDPLQMPKAFHRPPARKCAFLACAYVLSPRSGFHHPLARRIAETVQRTVIATPAASDLVLAVRAALARDFSTDLTPIYYGYRLTDARWSEVGRDRLCLSVFLSAMSGARAPSRGAVNNVATYCLSRVREDARAAAWKRLDDVRNGYAWTPVPAPPAPPRSGLLGVLERLFISPPPAPPITEKLRPGVREAVLALLPEEARDNLAGVPWVGDQIPPAIRTRLGRIASKQEAAAAGAEMADLVREVLGNPFRTVTIDPAWLVWNHGAVRHIATQIEATANFADLPILADALEEAGCTDEHLLRHCREERMHVPGCWALDAILGRA